MKNRLLIITVLVLICSCNKKQELYIIEKPRINHNVDDSDFVLDLNYKKGDVRRYGLHPNKRNSEKIFEILELGEKGFPIYFPKGYYPINIMIKGKSDIKLFFDNAVIGGAFYIIDEDENSSSKIELNGKLTVLDKVFIRESNNISFDTLLVKTDPLKNIYGYSNRGVSIYAGVDKMKFNFLEISDTGGNTENHYKNTAASLQIHGWKNNPKNIFIKNLRVINSDRTGIYITGSNHKIENVQIENFGLGSNENMFGLEDATPGEEKEFSGAWINRCNNCEFDTISVSNLFNKADYSLRLDEGIYSKPTFVYNLIMKNGAKKLPVLDDKLTNILIKKVN